MFGRSNCRNMFQNAYGNGKNLILKKEKGWKEIYEEDTMERIVRPIELIARRRKEEKEKIVLSTLKSLIDSADAHTQAMCFISESRLDGRAFHR